MTILDQDIGRMCLWGIFGLSLRKILRQMQASISWVDHGQYATFSFQLHGYAINLGDGAKSSDFSSYISKNSVSKVKEKRKSGTLTVSCFFLLFLFFSPRQYRSLCLRGGKVISKDKRETKAQRLIFQSVILWHQNSEKQDSCLQAAYITEETWKMGK